MANNFQELRDVDEVREAEEILSTEPVDQDMIKPRLMLEIQRVEMRNKAFWVMVILLVALAILELYFLTCIIQTSGEEIKYGLIVLAISPIASTTLIVMAFLIGAFRGFNEEKESSIPVGMVRKILGGGSAE